MMKYKGYRAHIKYDDEAGLFHGEVANIPDVITFQARTRNELQTAFEESVDDYLEFCAARGECPLCDKTS